MLGKSLLGAAILAVSVTIASAGTKADYINNWLVQNLALLIFILLMVPICTTLDGVVMYMYADVVPSQFMAGFRLVSISGALAFTYFLLPHFGVEPMMVWTISGVVCFVLFQLSLYFIREGQYDKPVIETKKEIVRDYLKDGSRVSISGCYGGHGHACHSHSRHQLHRYLQAQGAGDGY